jgi:hypothetical protein
MVQTGDQDYLSAGYVITQPVTLSPERMDPLPPVLLSLSPAVTPVVPDAWALEWVLDSEAAAERCTAAECIAIAPTDLEALIQRVTARFDAGEFGWTCVFSSLDLARTFIQRFLPQATDVVLLGMGMRRAIAPAFVEANTPPTGIGTWGYVEMLQRRQALPPAENRSGLRWWVWGATCTPGSAMNGTAGNSLCAQADSGCWGRSTKG